MNARHVHAVITAGVANPSLIVRWRDEPQLLRGYGVEPSSVDLDALWRFAGLTDKVRHNTLRDQLPATFRLMRIAGLEVELFAAYASERAERGARFANTTEGRALDLMAFLDGWLDRNEPAQALLWDVVRHERTLRRLGKPGHAVGTSPNLWLPAAAQSPPSAAAVPRIRGEIVLHEMTSDPRAVATALSADEPKLAEIPRAPAYLCYWRAERTPQIAILQLGKLAFHVLSMIDGERSASAVYRALGATRRPDRAFLRQLGELQMLGVIGISRPR